MMVTNLGTTDQYSFIFLNISTSKQVIERKITYQKSKGDFCLFFNADLKDLNILMESKKT